ncbi:MAG: hypothetical protein KJ621_20050 [Proteobacteria bacterium]|nr:hypothetical protein [Pseudomonadota bacterium]MBU1742321.1 hypothetical protein [Pseudomonadota bacterium]
MTNIFGQILDHLSAVAANWVAAQRDRLRPQSRALTDAEKMAMAPWFAAETLRKARVVLKERCPSPDFLSPELVAQLRALNVDPTIFRMETMAGITFDELIVIATWGRAMPRLRPGLLFHELVHVAQYRALGVERFMAIYIRGFGEAGYRGTPPEAQAYALTVRFERGEVFSVEEEAGRLGPGRVEGP